MKDLLNLSSPTRPRKPCSSRRVARWLLAGVLLASSFGVFAQDQSPPPGETPAAEAEPVPPPEVEVVKARFKGAPGNRHVRSIRRFRRGGGRVDWSRQGDWVAFDQAGEREVYDIYLMNAKTEAERCLTCAQYALRKVHSLSPVWHPSGDYLVFVVQDLPRRMRLGALKLATAQRGLHGDLWAITRDGKQAWQLTRIKDNGGAVVDPHFSYEADRLVWSERVESRRGRWGFWALRVAEFQVRRGLPRLGKVETYEPEFPSGFTVAHGFTPNDRGLMISGSDFGRDIARFDLESGDVVRLTATPEYHDDLAFVAPRSARIVWVSDRGVARPANERLPYRGDLWFMDEAERLQERLTFFNDPKSDHYLGETLIDDVAWSPEGRQLMLHVVHAVGSPDDELAELAESDEPLVEEALYLVELDDSFVQ